LSKYVAIGSAVVSTAVGPLNALMQHLLEVQGIDPRTQPGDKFRKALNESMDVLEADEFEETFDPFKHIPAFSPVARAFERAKGKLSALISQEQFNRATDLTHVSDKPESALFRTAKTWEPPKPEVVDVDYENSLDELKDFIKKYNVSTDKVPVTTEEVKDSLKVLKKYADKLNTKKEKLSKSRQPVAVGKTKKVRGTSKVTKSFGDKAFFRRVKDE